VDTSICAYVFSKHADTHAHHKHTYTYTHIHACTRTHTHIRTYAHTYTHTHIILAHLLPIMFHGIPIVDMQLYLTHCLVCWCLCVCTNKLYKNRYYLQKKPAMYRASPYVRQCVCLRVRTRCGCVGGGGHRRRRQVCGVTNIIVSATLGKSVARW